MRDPSLAGNEEARLAALRHYEILDTPEESAFDELAWLASQICETPIANVSLVDNDRAWFKATVGITFKEMPRPLAFCNYAIGGRNPLFEVPNLFEDERFRTHPFVAGGPAIRFYAGAPLITAEGQRLGALFVVDFKPRQLTPDQRRALAQLSRCVVAEMELRLLKRRFTKWTERLIVDAEARLHQAQPRIDRGNFSGAAPRRNHDERKIRNSGLDHLTPREEQILGLVAQGLSNRETARRLGLAEATVKVYVQRIFKKTGVTNRTLLAVLVARRRRSSGKRPVKSPRT